MLRELLGGFVGGLVMGQLWNAVAARARPQAGWYEDPAHEAALRWWDGAKWTGHTAPR